MENIRYVSGFSGSTATVLVTQDRAILLVDSRYTLQAKMDSPDFEVVVYSGDPLKAAGDAVNRIAPVLLGFESEYVSYWNHGQLRSKIDKDTRLVATRGLMEQLKVVKDETEIADLRAAVEIADRCFSYLVSFIKPGMTEREVGFEIGTYMYRQGSLRQAFDPIVAAGDRAAFPHAKPTDAVLKPGQMVKLDFGAIVNGMGSDITRTVFLGEPDEKQREVYNVVLQAQLSALAAIKPGMKGKEVDAVARDYITSKGYGEYFGHNLGHCLGRCSTPGFTPTSETVIVPGMALTVEPGIYIEGWGGVRIEDDVLITEGGCEILTKSTKEIVVIS
jgi:Xaa-Pro aminopeptidase